MTAFLIILEIVLIILRICAGQFADTVKFFAVTATPLTYICVVVGVIMFVFIGVRLYREFKGKK